MNFKSGDRVCLAQAHEQLGTITRVSGGKVYLTWDDDGSGEEVDPDDIELLTENPLSLKDRYEMMIGAAQAVALLYRETAPDDDEMKALNEFWGNGDWPHLDEVAEALENAAMSFAKKHNLDPSVES